MVHCSTLENRYYWNALKIGYLLAFTKAFWKHWFQWFVSKFISMKSTSMKKSYEYYEIDLYKDIYKLCGNQNSNCFKTTVGIKGSSFLFQVIGSRFFTDKPVDNWFSFQIIEFHLNVRNLHIMELQMNFSADNRHNFKIQLPLSAEVYSCDEVRWAESTQKKAVYAAYCMNAMTRWLHALASYINHKFKNSMT